MTNIRVAFSLRVSNEQRYNEPRDSISRDWLRLCFDNNITPFLVPNILRDPASYLADLNPDIVVLTGGDSPGFDLVRDDNENKILDFAVENSLPVFGVCRGLQFINCYFGGQFTQIEGHVGTPHSVAIHDHWANFYKPEFIVNSFHKEAITTQLLASQLQIGATDNEGFVEGLYHPNYPIAAVMWHPEREGGLSADLNLMRSLFGKDTL